jgi:hypothetical protein
VVLAIEDIHWADHSTRDFLAFLIANARSERLLLVCSYRTHELHRGHPLRQFLAQHERRPAVERFDLRLFTEEELGEQLCGILGAEPDAALVQRLHERTGGNAFFAEELLAAAEGSTELPGSLRDALNLRIEVLPEQAQDVLRLAAAHGRLVSHRLLAWPRTCRSPSSITLCERPPRARCSYERTRRRTHSGMRCSKMRSSQTYCRASERDSTSRCAGARVRSDFGLARRASCGGALRPLVGRATAT